MSGSGQRPRAVHPRGASVLCLKGRSSTRIVTERLPALTPTQLIRVLEKAGLRVVRQTGGHTIMYKEGLPRPVPIPRHKKALRRGLQEAIVKQAGLTPEDISKLL